MNTKSSQNPIMSVNFTVNLTEDAIKSLVSMFGQQAINFIQGMMNQQSQAHEQSQTEKPAEQLAKNVAPIVQEQPSFDVKKVASFITDAVELAASGENVNEVNDMLSQQISEE